MSALLPYAQVKQPDPEFRECFFKYVALAFLCHGKSHAPLLKAIEDYCIEEYKSGFEENFLVFETDLQLRTIFGNTWIENHKSNPEEITHERVLSLPFEVLFESSQEFRKKNSKSEDEGKPPKTKTLVEDACSAMYTLKNGDKLDFEQRKEKMEKLLEFIKERGYDAALSGYGTPRVDEGLSPRDSEAESDDQEVDILDPKTEGSQGAGN